ncbi:ARL14 effector protein-like [Acipenser oxyrinchus oxyrinchus]|uniref:ARL14 effector protein-like n=1 Tax=Acipenser oxyrinchus oxyrinchus TaxID=40147 RepID=A0AAD8FZN1_ACIOX|nr:ARL14 effector protein-like [Acipenser oxyrinchus oxyrinchus]
MADLEPCTVGVQLQATHDCHKTFYCRQTGCKALREMTPSNALLLQLRTGIMSLTESDRVCFHHEKVYVDRYEDLQKACCDPFNTHKKAIKKGLKPLDLDEAMFLSEKFARHLVPGWKLCFRCSQLLTGYCNLDPDAGQRKTRNSEGRTAKALKSLQFANPGRQTEFAAEPGRRDKRRLQPNKTATNADRQTIGAKSKVYDSAGLLISSGLDLCDCLDEDCLGCFYPCPECRSRKCGVECRCDRKWLYEQVEIEGGEIIRNKHVG